ncbi:MAG: 5-oxoprolinase subunit PxpB [Akkermansiaceae bacterium]|nr:5-oxoprolinase subunit PxpB [Akkermansiaceae bacterium]
MKPLGDSAWLVEFPEKSGLDALAQVTGMAGALAKNRPAGVLDVVPAFDTVAVHFSGRNREKIRDWIEATSITARLPEGREIEIPVCYGGEFGPDLDAVASEKCMSREEVIGVHSGGIYTVAAIGFSPGFPYLLGLPEELHLPRRNTPRLEVPAGSVAIAGKQGGIYPFASPGGWHLLGRTDLSLFDPQAAHPALLKSGDRVRFIPVEKCGSIEKSPAAIAPSSERWIEVIHPGALTTVQDLGRSGYESSGVSPGGAVDAQALRIANLMVGNDEGAPALEICMIGPVLKFHFDAVIALTGATGKPQSIAAGQIVHFSKHSNSLRAYLAIAGGIIVPKILGSAATDLRAGFGGFQGRALQAGDRLEIGKAPRSPKFGSWHVRRAMNGMMREIELRFLPGAQADWFSENAHRFFREELFEISPNSDRMGARLSGSSLDLIQPREMISQPVVNGSVQVPPDGQPIILLAERQTIGGYPQIAHIISTDLPKLARAWPGAKVRFLEVTLAEAQNLQFLEEQDSAWLRTGLELLK